MQYEVIRKIILKRLVLLLAISIFSLNAANMVLAAFTDSYSKGGRLEIRTKLAQDGSGLGNISLNGVSALRYEMQGCDVAFTTETNGVVQNGNETREASVIMTDSLYSGFSGLDIFKGSFFNQDACINGKNLAVISESMAKQLYSSRDIIGSDILISGVKYRIAGIYREKSTLLSFLGNDGKNRVFIPLLSMDNGRNQPISNVYIAGDTVKNDEFRVHNLEAELSDKMSIFPSEVKITDYYGFQMTVDGVQAFCVFCVGLYILLVAFMGIFKINKNAIRLINEERDNYYFLEAVVNRRYDVLKAAGLVLLELGLAAATFTAIKFTLYLPSGIIPQDNIFDFSFYAQKIKETVIASNLSGYFYPSRLAAAGSITLTAELLLLAAFVVSFIAALSQLKLLRQQDITARDVIKPFSIAIAAALALSLVFALACGLVFIVAIKQSAVALVAAILYSLRGSLCNIEAINKLEAGVAGMRD